MSFVPMQLGKTNSPLLKRTVATPFNFRQRPLPYILRSLARSRMRLPTAIVSIPVISLMISKFINDIFIRSVCRTQARRLTTACTRPPSACLSSTLRPTM